MAFTHGSRFFPTFSLILLALAATLPASAQIVFSGSVTDNGATVTPGGYGDPYIATGNLVVGATGAGSLSLGDASLFANGRTLTFGTSATNTGDLTMSSATLALYGSDPSAPSQNGNAGGSLIFSFGALDVTGSEIQFYGSPGANGSLTPGSGRGGAGGNGGSVSLSNVAGTFGASLTGYGGVAGQMNDSSVAYPAAVGGNGGNVSITNSTFTLGGSVNLNGGSAGSNAYTDTPASAGGNAGSFSVTTTDLTLTSTLTAVGGNGSPGGNTTAATTNGGPGGTGGQGGAITLSGGSLTSGSSALDLSGGVGGNGGVSTAFTGGAAGNGGTGGSLLVNSGQVTLNANLSLRGGAGGQGGVGASTNQRGHSGAGGSGGSLTLQSGTISIFSGTTDLSGGAAGYVGYYGTAATPVGGNGGTLAVNGGQLNLQSSLLANGGSGGTADAATVAGNGGAGGSLTISDGEVNLNASTSLLSLAGGAGGYNFVAQSGGNGGAGGNISLSGGTLTFLKGSITLAGGAAGSSSGSNNGTAGSNGTLMIAGGTLVTSTPNHLDNNLVGNLALTSGTIHFTGSGGSINLGGKLGGALGSGNQLEFDQAITFATDYHLSGGSQLTLHDIATVTSGPTLTFDANAVLDLDLGLVATSKIIVASGAAVALPGSGHVILNFHDAGDFTAGTYDLIDASAAGALSYNLDAANFSVGTGIAGYSYLLSVNGDILQVTAMSIPEPPVWGLLAGGIGLGLLRRWRRQR